MKYLWSVEYAIIDPSMPRFRQAEERAEQVITENNDVQEVLDHLKKNIEGKDLHLWIRNIKFKQAMKGK